MNSTSLVPPDAVRVWRGFRAPAMKEGNAFFDKLGSVFIPATVKMQIDCGLYAYLPTIPAGLPGKPDTVPDETAILFWESQQTYWDAFNTLATRTYTLTHNGVYDMSVSGAAFPSLFRGSLAPNQPVYLVDRAADWMHTSVRHFIAARPDGQSEATFQAAMAEALAQIQKSVPLEGAIAVLGEAHLVYWELAGPAPLGQPAPSGIGTLKERVGWSQALSPAPTFVPVGLWDAWPGMDVRPGSSFNMQFTRRRER